MKQLNTLRTEIDNTDDQIVELLAKRFKVIKQIGEIKKANDIPALDEKRWAKVVTKIREKAERNQINPDLVEDIYNLIHDEAIRIEEA